MFEFKFLILVYDCYDVCCWVVGEVNRLGVDVNKLVLMGDSVGGNLVVVVCILVCDNNGLKIKV